MTGISERAESRQLAAHRELMDRLRALVGDDALEVQHVADGNVLRADARAAEHVATVARDVEGHAAVVPLREGYVGRLHLARLLEPPELQHEELRGRDAAGHLGQTDLNGLILGERPPEE